MKLCLKPALVGAVTCSILESEMTVISDHLTRGLLLAQMFLVKTGKTRLVDS